MNNIEDILQSTAHRPWPIPSAKWQYYQEWNRVLFLHWEIPFDLLRNVVPKQLPLDSFDGKYYISLVAFTMEHIRPRYLPAVAFVSDFHEINIRTYIKIDNKEGVYFLSIEAGKALSAFVARKLSGLPYRKTDMTRNHGIYTSTNHAQKFHFHTDYDTGALLTSKTSLDKWLTERYCLYLEEDNHIYRYDIHHKEWEIKSASVRQLTTQYTIDHIHLTNLPPNMIHYSDGVKVVAWNRMRL